MIWIIQNQGIILKRYFFFLKKQIIIVNNIKRLWSGALKLPHEVPYSDFIDGLGPGQKISRQALSLPCLGEVKMSLFLEKQKLNIEIMQAKNLKIKIGYRVMPGKLIFQC